MEYGEGTWLIFKDKYKNWIYHRINLWRETEGYAQQMKMKWMDIIIQSGVPEVRVIVEIIVKKN